ncbi:MAG: aminotransferase [Hyphomicrobiales bacterium]|nr:aminotransferase [Hyphomicrobiales bacterium]
MDMDEATKHDNLTRHWQEIDARHHFHSFLNPTEMAQGNVRVIVEAEGVYIYDSGGKKILDGMAGLWCVQVGYGREDLSRTAYEATKALPYYNTLFVTTTPPTAELAAKLAALTPSGCDYVFFANSGSEANDSAVKLIRYFWNLEGAKQKKTIISRQRAYHGVTMAAASLSGLQPMHPQFDLPLDGFVHVMAPYGFENGVGLKDGPSAETFAHQAAASLEEKILELGADNVAAFVGEPIMGAGGVIIPPPGYWEEIQRICKKYDVLLHVDEVICGFGRTGNWFGCDTFGIRPDLISMAKGLSSGYQPISAVALGKRMSETFLKADEELVHGFTYSGHPVAAAVALKNLEIIEREGLATRAGGDIGDCFAKHLKQLNDHPLVGETRSVGLMGAIELVEDKSTRKRFDEGKEVGKTCRNNCFTSGLIMRAVGDTMVLSPPLTITQAELDELFNLARAALDKTASQFR